MALDNTIATPLYQQLKDQIQGEIENGVWSSGSKLPTEIELSDTYQVSRVTVRKALDELSKLGYLERKSGKGTFVAEKKIQRTLSCVLSFTDMCHIIGTKPGAKVIKMAIEQPEEDEREKMKLGPDDRVIIVERIRYSDGHPVILERCKFPEHFDFLFGENLNNASLYSVISEKKGIVFEQSQKEIEIVFATAQEAKDLEISKGYPLLMMNSIVWDASIENCHLSRQLCIGDKFKLMV